MGRRGEIKGEGDRRIGGEEGGEEVDKTRGEKVWK